MERTNDMEYYEEMIQVIASHVDFGKRNPVDIGIECGYSEEEVMEMIRACSAQEEDSEETKERDIYYFIIKKEEQSYIASVNAKTWETSIVKEIDRVVEGYYGWGDERKGSIAQIKDEIYARVDDSSGMILMWENLNNGEHGKFLADAIIKQIFILDKEIIALTCDEIIGLGFHGEIRRKELKSIGRWSDRDYSCSTWIEGKDKFYLPRNDFYQIEIWTIDKKFRKEKCIEFRCNALDKIVEAEYVNEDLYCYTKKQCIYTESNPEKVGRSDHAYTPEYSPGTPEKIFRTVRTKNYCMHGNGVYTKNETKKICGFDRYEGSPVIGIFEKDIFIGTTKDGDCIKIDLQNERTPVILPIELD